MKVSVQQIMLFDQAAKDLKRFVAGAIEDVPVAQRHGETWAALLKVEQSANTVIGMADAMVGAEVNIKG